MVLFISWVSIVKFTTITLIRYEIFRMFLEEITDNSKLDYKL